jgi:hypothetical protein
MLLKKRIVVYCPSMEQLLGLVRAVPLFVLHREDWSILRPLVNLHDADELADLGSLSHFVAGTVDSSVSGHSELYDLCVNIADQAVLVPEHAKESLQMGKLHKEIAGYLMQAAADESVSDADLVDGLAAQTRELIGKLHEFAATGEAAPPKAPAQARVTLESIRARKLAPVTQTFLWNLAVAEGLAEL